MTNSSVRKPTPRRRSVLARRLALAGLVATALACAPPRVATLEGEWVIVASSGSAGIAGPPRAGEPIETSARGAGDACVAPATLDAHFGPQCEIHQSEGGAPPIVAGEVLPGNHPVERQVRWYCDKRTIVRLSLERCDETGGPSGFRINQIAVSIREAR